MTDGLTGEGQTEETTCCLQTFEIRPTMDLLQVSQILHARSRIQIFFSFFTEIRMQGFLNRFDMEFGIMRFLGSAAAKDNEVNVPAFL